MKLLTVKELYKDIIDCPYCGKQVIMDWKCSKCGKEIAYDINDNFVRSNPHKKETK